jgi:hypothetical protein
MPSLTLTPSGMTRLLAFTLVIDWMGFLAASVPQSSVLHALRVSWLLTAPFTALFLLLGSEQQGNVLKVGRLLTCFLGIFTFAAIFYSRNGDNGFTSTMVVVVMLQVLVGFVITLCATPEVVIPPVAEPPVVLVTTPTATVVIEAEMLPIRPAIREGLPPRSPPRAFQVAPTPPNSPASLTVPPASPSGSATSPGLTVPRAPSPVTSRGPSPMELTSSRESSPKSARSQSRVWEMV